MRIHARTPARPRNPAIRAARPEGLPTTMTIPAAASARTTTRATTATPTKLVPVFSSLPVAVAPVPGARPEPVVVRGARAATAPTKGVINAPGRALRVSATRATTSTPTIAAGR